MTVFSVLRSSLNSYRRPGLLLFVVMVMVLLSQLSLLTKSLLFPLTISHEAFATTIQSSLSELPALNLGRLQKRAFFRYINTEDTRGDNKIVDEKTLFNAPERPGGSKLTGVVISSEPQRSLAIIGENGSQKSYATNDKIDASGEKIVRIFHDRVAVMLPDRSLFTLRLPEQ